MAHEAVNVLTRASCEYTGLSVDVEEWFHVPGHPVTAGDPDWNQLPATLPEAIDKSLALLEEMAVSATFFILGRAAERYPSKVRAIAEAGHETACHGWDHHLVSNLSHRFFKEDSRRAKEAVEDATGERVYGFRAPCWSMPEEKWPYEVLGEAGFQYSSSRLSIPGLGMGHASPRMVEGIVELPVLRYPSPLFPVPCGGTIALRLLPAFLLRRAKRKALEEHRPAIYWFHPWELLAGAPRLSGGPLFKLVRYAALSRLPGRLSKLVSPGDRRLLRLAAFYGTLGR